MVRGIMYLVLMGIENRLFPVMDVFAQFLACRLLPLHAFLFRSPNNFLIPLRLRLAATVCAEMCGVTVDARRRSKEARLRPQNHAVSHPR
jgi:hypothetical protein